MGLEGPITSQAAMSDDVENPASAIIRRQAQRCSVRPDVHPDDHIFNFLANHPGFETDEARIAYYFQDGARSPGNLVIFL